MIVFFLFEFVFNVIFDLLEDLVCIYHIYYAKTFLWV